MRLVLFRHGIAIDREHPECPPDPERYLTAIGLRKTELAARGLGVLGLEPEAIISSPYVRAFQTAEIAKQALGHEAEIEIDSSLIGSKPAKKIISQLRARPETDGPLLLCGHAPHLDELIGYLCGDGTAFTRMKKAAAVIIDTATLTRGSGTLTAHYPPRALRALGHRA